MPRLNTFENFPLQNIRLAGNNASPSASVRIHAVIIPGDISFNNVIYGFGASGTTAKTLSLYFGLYSLNVSTLSLANSASTSTNPATNTTAWISLGTSTTQNITPGVWYFAFNFSTAGNSLLSYFDKSNNIAANSATYPGPFFRGLMSVTTNAMPGSIATSDLTKEGATDDTDHHPYVIISA